MTKRVRDNRNFSPIKKEAVDMNSLLSRMDDVIDKMDDLNDPDLYDIIDELREIHQLMYEVKR